MSEELTQEYLREVLRYIAKTGIFKWRVAVSRSVKVGDVAGTLQNKGYIHILLRGRKYVAHRLAWFYLYGEWPSRQLDHRNGRKDDNRRVNLRLVTNAENQQNTKGARRNNSTGYLGVSLHKRLNKYSAQIYKDGKKHHLGYFDTGKEAHKTYLAAKRKLHPFNELNKEKLK